MYIKYLLQWPLFLQLSFILCVRQYSMLFISINSLKYHNSRMKTPLSSFRYDKTGTDRLRDLPKVFSREWQGRVPVCAPAAALGCLWGSTDSA